MLTNLWASVKQIHRPNLRREKGQSIIIFAFAILGIIALLGLALDLGLVYIERTRVNRTTDAAALAAVVELPYEQDAMERAIEYIGLNGYGVGQDTEILIRGCADLDRNAPFNSGNVAETNTNPIAATDIVTGALYIPATQQPPRATFVIDTGSYQATDGDSNDDAECNPGADLFGTANKIDVRGVVNVRMNFMQFFGFGRVPVSANATAENVTNLDVMVVFDVSGSMEYETNCYDCYVRTSYNPNFPGDPTCTSTIDGSCNGYFNPIPYNPDWNPGAVQSIAASSLCTAAPTPYGRDGYQYMAHEAELYSAEQGNWNFDVRAPGQGFWVIQRGTRNGSNVIAEVGGGSTNNESNWQGNRSREPDKQSSNVCGPVAGGIDCTASGNNNICDDDKSNDAYVSDCSAYIASHPYATYSQDENNDPKLQGAAYNSECFSGATFTGACWSSKAAGPGPSNVPYVEYDFFPTWGNANSTYIWIRAAGGGQRANEWNGDAPSQLQEDYAKTVFWQVDGGTINESTNSTIQDAGDWRDNRVTYDKWRWIRLNSSGLTLPYNATTPHVLRLYQGSAGYKIDKIIFTNDPNTNVPNAMRLNNSSPQSVAGATDYGRQVGPPASNGSATREACNVCNPAYGYQVDPAQCTCSKNSTEAASTTDYGSGTGCTVALEPTSYLNDDLFSGIQPIRGAQEAVKRFIYRLDPKYDQVGIVSFTTDTVNDGRSRSKLQCIRWAGVQGQNCFDVSAGTPISYTLALQAIERQWPQGGTDIGEGMREALEELGVNGYATDSACTATANDGHACDRRGAARRVIVLLTDGSPNNNPGNCAPGSGRPDLWDGLVGPNEDDYECAMYYAWEARNNNVTLYVIGLGAGVNIDFLNAMATGVDPRGGVLNDGNDVTYFNGIGGQFYNAATPDDLDAIFETILSNIYVRIVG